MAALTFRNSAGDLVDVPSVPASRFKNEFGTMFERATHGGAVAITRHDTPRAVLISYAEFKALVESRTPALDALSARFDAMLERMQTPDARKAIAAAFDASPATLGRSAVKAARKR
jgi:prevent-host-death family protein